MHRAPTEPGRAVLDATDLYRFYHAGDEETLALRGVSLHLHRGEMVAVTGPSGSGKSTLLACVAGLDEPDGGMVRLLGRRMTRRSERERTALRVGTIGMLFQHANLIAHLTVRQNIHIAQRLAGRTDRSHSTWLLERTGLRDRASARPATLSGGEAARAGLAVALANAPALVLADEPTGELDDATATRILTLLREYAAAGAAVVVVTHNNRVAAVCDRTVELSDGRVV
jgi:putative ABC transport system ATP-binding protein